MATPANAPYKKAQRAARRSKYNFIPIWTSCEILDDSASFPGTVKRTVQGTCRVRSTQKQTRGKAAIKAEKRHNHYPRFYHLMKSILPLDEIRTKMGGGTILAAMEEARQDTP